MPTVIEDNLAADAISFDSESYDIADINACYEEYGCFVIRGFNARYVDAIYDDIKTIVSESHRLLDSGKFTKSDVGWGTPNGTLFLPAPESFERDQQIMCLPLDYHVSAAFMRCACDPRSVEIATAILGPNVELFMHGQSLYKEPCGGHPKKLHQDSSYFEHLYEGPLAQLNYVVDTNFENGALHVVPGSHKLGVLPHVTTFSHLGLDENEWPLEKAVCIEGGPGDAIFFHVNCIHGSPENHSSGPRPVFINRYRRADDFVVAGGTLAENRSGREEAISPVKPRDQYNTMLAGVREYKF
jgi:hypothetical protein